MKTACISVVAYLAGLTIVGMGLLFLDLRPEPPKVAAKMHYTGLSFWTGTEWKRSYEERWDVVLKLPDGGETTVQASREHWEKLHVGDDFVETW